jgi:hypothetical protein
MPDQAFWYTAGVIVGSIMTAAVRLVMDSLFKGQPEARRRR